MKNNISLWLSLFLLTLSFTLLSCNSYFLPKKKPIAKDGFLDLTGWDFKRDGLIELSGEWKFRWLADDEQFRQGDYNDTAWETINVPGNWDPYTGTNSGYGWLRLKVKLNTKKTLAVQLTGVFSSYQLYLNGKKLLQNGVPGVTKETSIPQQLPLIKEFHADTILTFAWKISNFHSMNGGAPLSPVIGLSKAVRNFYWGMDVFYCIIIGIILFMSLYNFSLWIVRPKDIPSLYLALACFMIFIRIFTNKFFLSRIFYFASIFELHFKLEYISSALILVFSIYYFYSLFPKEFLIRKHRLNLIIIGMIVLFFCFTSYSFFSRTIQIFYGIAAIIIIWCIVKLVMTIRKKRNEALIVFIGLSLFYIAIFIDIGIGFYYFIAYRMSIIHAFTFVPIGFVLFTFTQSIALSKRFARAYSTAEHLTHNLQKEVEAKTKTLEEQKIELEKVNLRLKEKDRYKTIFFQNITHELRTPLTCILGPLESAINGIYGGITSVLRKHLKIIINNARTLLEQINQLLELARSGAGKMELHLKKVDLLKLLKYIVAGFESHAARKNMKLQVETNVEELSIFIDQEKIEKIPKNLISNAFKFSDQGGSVIISLFFKESIEKQMNDNEGVKDNKEKEEIERKRFIEIRVKDTGCGIAEKDIHRIFNRFQRGDGKDTGKYDGFGIGLSIVKDYVELHGGSIDVKSHPGEGAEFIVSLPFPKKSDIPEIFEQKRVYIIHDKEDTVHVNNNRYQKEEEKEYDHNIESEKKERILIVEDNDDMREYIKDNLKYYFSVYEAKDGEIGLDKAIGLKPDLILSDIMMPNMNGYQLLKRIRENKELAHVPFIFITAKGYEDSIDEIKDIEPDDYLSKPFNAKELRTRIKNLLKLRNQNKQLALFSKQHILPKVKRDTVTTKKGPPYPELPVLVVDDNQEVLGNYEEVLTFNGITNFILCKDSREVIPCIKKQPVSIILLDLAMPYISGQELLKEIKENYPEIEVIVVTGLNTLEDAVECTRYGAYDYMVKPVEINRLVSNIKHYLEMSRLRDDVKSLSSKIQSRRLINPDAFSNIITRDEKMFSLFRCIESIAESSSPVLITGESGVGKELIPPVIHTLSKKSGELVTVNVAGVDDTIFSDTLFGHTRGAFTGAETDRGGLLEEARGGTIFLDEIGDLSPSSQVKLLRLLEEGQYRPLGADKVKISDARIIVATNTDLKEKIKEGTFRNDLFQRLTYHIFVPPLRMRKTDIPLLVDHFLEMRAKSKNAKKPAVPNELFNLLHTYHFPGNIRELEQMIKNAMSEFKSKMLSLKYFKKHIQENTVLEKIHPGERESIKSFFDLSHGFPTLEQVEDIIIDEALKKSKGNLTLAARLLDISASKISRRMKKRKR